MSRRRAATLHYDQLNHLTQVAMPRNTANGMVTQTRTFVYAPTTYSTLTTNGPLAHLRHQPGERHGELYL